MITLGAAALTANPVSAALPSTVTAINYFDVFGFGNASASATIDFHGTDAAPVTSGSTVYFYNSASGGWVAASNCTVSVANGFVEVSIAPGVGATPNTAPSPAQFEGTPFALVNSTTTTTTAVTTTTTTTTAVTTVATTTATTAVVTTATTTAKTTTTTPAKTTTKTTAATTVTHTPGKAKPVIPSGLLYGVIAISVILVVVIVIVIVRAGSV
jgi:predicted extracellular nuclease